ncbi:MAG: hypothetical protein PUB07_03185 [Clostridia bacterium]|nr:hypothetical protein [Clostridia bacterium]
MRKFLKWLDNYWYHNKIITLIVLFFVFSGIVYATNIIQKRDPDFVVVYVSGQYGNESQFAPIREKVEDIVGDLDGDGRKTINYRIIAIRDNIIESYDVNKKLEFDYSLLDKSARLYLIEEKYAKEKAAYFIPLEDILPPEKLEDGIKNEEGKVIAIPLRDNAVGKKMQLDQGNMYVAMKALMDLERNDELANKGVEKAKEIFTYIANEGK